MDTKCTKRLRGKICWHDVRKILVVLYFVFMPSLQNKCSSSLKEKKKMDWKTLKTRSEGEKEKRKEERRLLHSGASRSPRRGSGRNADPRSSGRRQVWRRRNYVAV